MSLIRNIKFYPCKRKSPKPALLMCGFGGSIWQATFLIRTLHRAGYDVTAMDFSESVLSQGDPALLLQLTDEVVAKAEAEAKRAQEAVLIVGISLGALMALNILRRSPLLHTGVLITGGDIVKVAQNIYGAKVWPQSYDELATLWSSVNIYTKPALLAGKRLLFVLPAKDKLIDPEDVRQEMNKQVAAGNRLVRIERHSFGHIGTIIEETVLFPRRVLRYIKVIQE
jgi:pimeloyl-ACP methyl ester carboxylesterase